MKDELIGNLQTHCFTSHGNSISAKPEDDEEPNAGGGVPVPPKPK